MCECHGWCRSIAFRIGRDPGQSESKVAYPLRGQSFAIADLLCPTRDDVLVWNELLGIITHPVPQKALSCLLEKGKLDHIRSRSTVFGEMLGRSVKFVGR